MYFNASIAAVLMIALFTPDTYAADEKQKKSITYTKKKKKATSSAKKKKKSSSSSSTSSSDSNVSVGSYLLMISPWRNCDLLVGKSTLFFNAEECSSPHRAKRLQEGSLSKNFTIEFAYGIEAASWSPGSDETENQGAVEVASVLKYQTEGLILQKFDFQLSYLGKPLISFVDERPLIPSENQEALMQIREKNTSSNYTRYTYGIQLTPLLEMLEVESNFLNFIFSYRYQFSSESFLGEATAQDDLEYLQKNATFDSDASGTFVTSGAIAIKKGETVSFKTLFKNEEHSVDLTQIWGPARLPLNAGIFNSSWERPSDNKRAIEIDGKPVAFDTAFNSQGFLLEVGPRFPASVGFKMSIKAKFGVNSKIENAALVPLGIDFNENFETLRYQETDFKVWYNHVLTPGMFKGDELFLSVGYHYNQRVWEFETEFDDGSRETTKADEDTIHKFYTQLRYLF